VKRQVGQFLQRFAVKTDKGGETQKVDLLEKLLVELGARYQNRPGGYTRIIKLGRRRGDNAPMSLIELVDEAPAASKATRASESASTEAAAG
jgi:large subunit ribosomal protein L17